MGAEAAPHLRRGLVPAQVRRADDRDRRLRDVRRGVAMARLLAALPAVTDRRRPQRFGHGEADAAAKAGPGALGDGGGIDGINFLLAPDQ